MAATDSPGTPDSDEWTTDDIPVDGVLDGAKHLEHVLVLGWCDDGSLYAASSKADGAWALALCERFKQKLEAGDYYTTPA
jgi:hypothetical protein